MVYDLNGKLINIKDEEIHKLEKTLKCSTAEAIDIYLTDREYIVNAEQEKLTKKAQESGISTTIHQARSYKYDKEKQKTQRQRATKENPTKEGIINAIVQILPTLNAENIVVEKAGKLIAFTVSGQKYTLDLIQKRK